jgi:dynein heavy chain
MSEKLLKEISASTAVAEKEKARVAVIVEGVVAKANEIDAKKIEAEEDLKLAQPAMDEALEALNSIDQKSISQLKTMKNPPDLVKRIFDTVLLLRQLPMAKIVWKMKDKVGMVIDGSENYKEEAMKMMADTGFLNKLLNFPKERINDETCELLEPYFDAPDFNFEDAKKSAGAVAGLCNWCRSMVKYHWVAAVVDPKMRALREAQATLDEANREKAMAEGELAEVQAGLDAMQAKFDEAMAEKQRLIDDAAATQARMDAATALITALAGEEVRWTEQSKQFAAQIQRLTGDCALASSFTSYLGPFNKEFRDLLLTRDFFGDLNKREIPVTADLDVARFLVDDSEIGEWTLQGLPTDELSIQNGIMTTRASRYPVLVDPQGQGINWIKNREAENNLKVTNLNEKRFRDILEESMSYGLPMLIENIQEELDPILEPVLEKRIVRKGKQAMIVLSDGKEVDYDDNFTLICTTRLPNPHYSPELSAKVTVIDFTVTMVGLEDQLLGKLILKEKNELEVQRKTLVEEVTSYKKKIKQLEDDLLFRLSNSQGNLLDDVELIEVLNVTKKTAQEVNEKLANASETNAKITETCEEYRPVAHRATLIYFLIAEFASVNVMYQTSLKQFNELYELAIDEAEPSGKPATRIKNIIDHMTYSVYLYIQRGLFERHKLTFALMMTNTILVSDKILNPELVSVFLKGGGSLDIKSVKKKPKEWIPDKSWLDCVALSSYPTFATLQDSMRDNNKKWQDWYDKEAPENVRIPDFEDVVTPFERMCLVKALREDRTQVAAQAYIADAIGQRFVESVPLNIEATWDESTPYVPIICLLSPGSDPTKLIEELAKRQKIKVNGVSMGQGQEIIARKLMTSATREGHWVLLQNTHLGLNYMGRD